MISGTPMIIDTNAPYRLVITGLDQPYAWGYIEPTGDWIEEVVYPDGVVHRWVNRLPIPWTGHRERPVR